MARPRIPRASYILAPGDRLTTLEAGGGGYGDPRQRDREALARDIAQGFVSSERARADYGAD